MGGMSFNRYLRELYDYPKISKMIEFLLYGCATIHTCRAITPRKIRFSAPDSTSYTTRWSVESSQSDLDMGEAYPFVQDAVERTGREGI